jgi:hypothetical protein
VNREDSEQWQSYVSVLRRAAAERRELARKRYEAGESVLEIALDLGVAYSTVGTYLAGLRRQGPHPRYGHGTEARARRHWRDGDKPLTCIPCLAAAREASYLRRNPDGGGKYRLDRSN